MPPLDPKKVGSLNDVTPDAEYAKDVASARDVLNKPFFIMEYDMKDGEFSPYALITVQDADGEEQVISCGAEMVLHKLGDVASKKAFPIKGQFIQRGRMLDLVGW